MFRKITPLILLLAALSVITAGYADTITAPDKPVYKSGSNTAILQYCKVVTQNADGKQVKVTMCRGTDGNWYLKN